MTYRATFTIHDQPSILPSFERMKELTDLAKKGQGGSDTGGIIWVKLI